MSELTLMCPHCGNVVEGARIVSDRRTGGARGHCSRCRTWSPLQFPSIRKKLVYLDQSFLSNLCPPDGSPVADPILNRLFSKLQRLKVLNRIYLVVSDVHCRETSGFPEQYLKEMKKLWKFQSDLADGRIAADWVDVFVAQHRRMLAGDSSDPDPVTDIGLDDPHRVQIGIRIVTTNSWMPQNYRDYALTGDEVNNEFREIIDRQVENIPYCQSVADCLNYVRVLWRNNIQQGITAWQQKVDFLQSFEQLGDYPDASQLASLPIPHLRNALFQNIIGDLTSGLDETAVLQRWSELLKNDPIGPCPSLRIRTALEAELLWTRYQKQRPNPKKFNENFGLSRQNDIDHVSAFVPYVNALTTDNDMHNLCKRKVVDDEIKRFQCKIFSKKNYDEFEEWLDGLLTEPNSTVC